MSLKEQPLKAYSPIAFTLSLMDTFVKELQSLKAAPPIVFTLSPIDTFAKLLQPLNAQSRREAETYTSLISL